MSNTRNIPKTLYQALKPVTLVCGHYGVGKTNFTLNLAKAVVADAVAAGSRADVCVVDLDIVNPYFRTSEYARDLQKRGIKTVTPVMANSSLDSPSLSAQVDGAISWAHEGADTEGAGGAKTSSGNAQAAADAADTKEASSALTASDSSNRPRLAIFDVGGDDVGATALGRYAHRISKQPYTLIYVVNAYRSQTQTPDEALEIMLEIERACGLRVSGIVNNSHLRGDTSAETVLDARNFGIACAAAAHVPLLAQTCPRSLFAEINERATAQKTAAQKSAAQNTTPQNQADIAQKSEINFFQNEMLVKTPWE